MKRKEQYSLVHIMVHEIWDKNSGFLFLDFHLYFNLICFAFHSFTLFAYKVYTNSLAMDIIDQFLHWLKKNIYKTKLKCVWCSSDQILIFLILIRYVYNIHNSLNIVIWGPASHVQCNIHNAEWVMHNATYVINNFSWLIIMHNA